jgi:hyperosmotically inducible periplasmic protein
MKNPMKTSPIAWTLLLALAVGSQVGCQQNKSPDVKDNVTQSLNQAGLRDVNVSQDRDKGVVTLTGSVASDEDKSKAESIARTIAGGEVIANQISVRPPGNESTDKAVQSDLDKGIEKNVDAALTKHKWNRDIHADVKNGVVTLKGKVNSKTERAQIEKVVSQTPNVDQVVNEIEVGSEKATSSR